MKKSLEIKKRTGYVAEAQRMYDWMKVDEIIWFCKGFYPDWDDGFPSELKNTWELPGDSNVVSGNYWMSDNLTMRRGGLSVRLTMRSILSSVTREALRS